ncbi:MAG: hypothetical protein AAGF57_09685 [Pseudomonadota bacterium]
MKLDLLELASAARPGLFDTIRTPDLMTVLILANLMSPELWRVADAVKARVSAKGLADDLGYQHTLINEALTFVDHHFTHLVASEVSTLIGVVNLDDERTWNGAELVDKTIAEIHDEYARRATLGTLAPGVDPEQLVLKNEFPVYTYLTIEGMHAERLLEKRKYRRSKGISICADEATLIASLLCILGVISFHDFVIIGAPAHYSVLTFGSEDRSFWSNGKKEFFDHATWKSLLTTNPETDAQLQFDMRLNSADRIITPAGFALLKERKSTLPAKSIEVILRETDAFFGMRLRQLEPLAKPDFPSACDTSYEDQFNDFVQPQSADDVQQKVRQKAAAAPGSVFDKALYCFRDISVAEPNVYLLASLHGPKLRQVARDVQSFQDACEIVEGIAGDVSSRRNPDHICLPDETLLFHTGDLRDKALLLLSLLVASPVLRREAVQNACLTFAARGACVFWRQRWFDLEQHAFTNTTEPATVTIAPAEVAHLISIVFGDHCSQ